MHHIHTSYRAACPQCVCVSRCGLCRHGVARNSDVLSLTVHTALLLVLLGFVLVLPVLVLGFLLFLFVLVLPILILGFLLVLLVLILILLLSLFFLFFLLLLTIFLLWFSLTWMTYCKMVIFLKNLLGTKWWMHNLHSFW